MPVMNDDTYQIILDPVDEDKQSAAALFLSGCFSLPPASTRRFAAAGPIAILSDLDGVQADLILSELVPSLPAGVSLRAVREDEAQEVSRLDWPHPPKVFGRPLEDFTFSVAQNEAPCPACGKMLRITYEPGSGASVKPARASGKSQTVMIPNPASVEGDKDPLFSGFKPLAVNAASFASVRSLQAGDTGFWGDSGFFPPQAESSPEARSAAQASGAEPPPAKAPGGLTAYMQPGAFAVVLARTRETPVVKKIAEILGVGEDEAREKCLSPGLCVARGISLGEAQTLAARLKNLGGRARIVKPR